eukprot:PITA_25557
MRDVEHKYDIIEKQVYAISQDLKSFRMNVLHSLIIAYVPNSAVKIVLTQPDTDGKRGRWITQILEFDLTIKTTKLIKGQGLAKHLDKSNCEIQLHHSTPYYPQGNGLVESSNKSLVKVIKKTLADHKKSRDSHLIYAIWANRITPKRSTGKYPFQLIYGKDAIFPTNLAFPILKFLQDSTDEPHDFSRRINQIIKLNNENRDEVQYKLMKYQNKMKTLFDRRARERDFKEGDVVLRWDARREEKGKHGKFDNLWFRPLTIAKVKGNNTFVLQNLEGLYSTYPVNGRFLKHYIQY